MHFDGSKMLGGLGAGIVLTSPKGDWLEYVLQIHFKASNNVAEYEALSHGLRLAKEIGVNRILYFGDSDLVVQQVSGEWDARDANMALYRFHIQKLSASFDGCEFHHVPRVNNEAADLLARIGSTRQAIPPGVSLEHLRKPSINLSPESDSIIWAGSIPAGGTAEVQPAEPAKKKTRTNSGKAVPSGSQDPGAAGSSSSSGAAVPGTPPGRPPDIRQPEDRSVLIIREVPSWAQPFMNYIANGEFLDDEVEARQIRRCAHTYTIINDELYKRSVSGIF